MIVLILVTAGGPPYLDGALCLFFFCSERGRHILKAIHQVPYGHI